MTLQEKYDIEILRLALVNGFNKLLHSTGNPAVVLATVTAFEGELSDIYLTSQSMQTKNLREHCDSHSELTCEDISETFTKWTAAINMANSLIDSNATDYTPLAGMIAIPIHKSVAFF